MTANIYNFKTYHGSRVGNKTFVRVQLRGESRRLMHIVRHSPDGFEWGYGGSGPTDLALAILTDVMGEEPRRDVYNQFKWDFVARWGDVWSITEAEVLAWLENNGWKVAP